MYLALSICVLFISPMQSVNRATILNITSSLLFFGSAASGGTSATAIVPLTSIYSSV